MQRTPEEQRKKYEEMCAAHAAFIVAATTFADKLLKHKGKIHRPQREWEFLKAYGDYLRSVEEL